MRGFAYRINTAKSAIAEVRLAKALAQGDRDTAKAQLELVKDLPATQRARVKFELGETDEALKLARDASNADEAQTRPLANLADLLWRADKKDEALVAFDKLRKLSARLDLDVPAFARHGTARRCALTAGRLARAISRPPMTPACVPTSRRSDHFAGVRHRHRRGALPDSEGKQVSLADFKGQPVLVVFYLGSGCAKCIDQLNTFAPMQKQFADAGIKIVAIGTEPRGRLAQDLRASQGRLRFSLPDSRRRRLSRLSKPIAPSTTSSTSRCTAPS